VIDWINDVNYDGPIAELGHAEGHHCYLYHHERKDGEFRARCSCDASWTYGKTRTLEYMTSIYESHLAYFNKPPTLVL
jgi:hypothetical protein